MKKHILSMAMLAAGAFAVTSCVNDLDTVPLNDYQRAAEDAYATSEDMESGLAYIYASYSNVSQNDPGSSDIAVDDAGQSELVRQYVNLNEFSCDGLKCTWGDSYIKGTQEASWTKEGNTAITAVYTRSCMAITRVNALLKMTEGSSLEGAEQYRAEARFLRAYAYWMLMDLFGNPPFMTPDNLAGDKPKQIKRADLYAWLVTELQEIIPQLPTTNIYPRVAQGAAQALLARIYLNAEVYTGTAEWKAARDMAEQVIAAGNYQLCPDYEKLFLQDNSETEAAKEMIFAVAYDAENTQSWGGTTHLVSACLNNNQSQVIAEYLGFPAGSYLQREHWNGYHVPAIYVTRNFKLVGEDWSDNRTGLGYDREKSDKRAFLINIGCKKGYDKSKVDTGWRCWKFSSRDSKGTLMSTDEYTKFSSIDFPMIRLAEMYLIYAEAQCRIDGGQTADAKACGYINALHVRAGIENKGSYSLDDILCERGAEFMWEGHRRQDLIRYGYYNSASFAWPYKGGVSNGRFAIPTYRNIYPLLASDVSENENLKQNQGY